MSLTAVFEAGTIMDVIARAEKAAPKVTDGSMRYAGMVLDVQPVAGRCTVRTTNEQVYYREVVDLLETEGSTDRTVWRLPSEMLAKMISTFTAKAGDTITFSQTGGMVAITQNRKKAQISTRPLDMYPDWYELDPNSMHEATDLGAKLKWVEWATDSEHPELSTIISADALIGTNRYVMARAPLDIAGLEESVMIAPGSLNGLIPLRGTIKLRRVGGQLLVIPDDRTQVVVSTIDKKLPSFNRALRNDYPQELRIAKDAFAGLAASANTVRVKNLSCLLRLFIGDNQIAGIAQAEDVQDGIRDILDVVGAGHEKCEYYVNPTFLANALGNCPDDFVTMKYDNIKRGSLLIEGASGYQVWISPIDPGKAKSAAAAA